MWDSTHNLAIIWFKFVFYENRFLRPLTVKRNINCNWNQQPKLNPQKIPHILDSDPPTPWKRQHIKNGRPLNGRAMCGGAEPFGRSSGPRGFPWMGVQCAPTAHFSGVSSIEKCRGVPRNGSGKEEAARIAVLGKTTRNVQLDAAPTGY